MQQNPNTVTGRALLGGVANGHYRRVTYTPDFFKSIGSTARASAGVVLPVLFEVLGTPNTMLDVGCGTGAWLETARQLGVGKVLGVDGAYLPRDQLLLGEDEFLEADLSRPLDLEERFDLALTLEVAEHLPESSAPTFVETLCRHADAVVFSAAVPNQGGEHHVNERLPSYWAELFHLNGFDVFDVIRPRIWDDERVMFYYRQNILVFAKAAAAEQLRALPAASPLDVVHPQQLAYWHEVGASEAWPMFLGSLRRTARAKFARSFRG